MGSNPILSAETDKKASRPVPGLARLDDILTPEEGHRVREDA